MLRHALIVAALALLALPAVAQAGTFQVVGNTITGNVPVDVLLGSPELSPFLRPVGEGIVFVGNTCNTSIPPEICGSGPS